MATRSLNKVMLIGNLTRDPELRYTAQGTAVCNFGLATNRYWVTETGERKEDTEFHRIVAWNKLAELCAQLLAKGRKVFVEGRLQTRTWAGADGAQRTTTEIVISEMVILDSKRAFEAAKMAEAAAEKEIDVSAEKVPPAEEKKKEEEKSSTAKKADQKKKKPSEEKSQEEEESQGEEGSQEETVTSEEIPF